jgi:hypothetical protein
MDKNIIHIFACERKKKGLKLSHEMTSTKKPPFNCAIKE